MFRKVWGCDVWWLDDVDREGDTKYYPNDSSRKYSDYLHSEAEAHLICDQLNLRDYGCVDG